LRSKAGIPFRHVNAEFNGETRPEAITRVAP